MDDDLEDKIFYQTYISHMKLLSKFAVGIPPLNTSLTYCWRLFRIYLLRPEVLLFGLIFFVFLMYIKAVEMWSRGLLGRLPGFSSASAAARRSNRMQMMSTSSAEKQSWETVQSVSAVYAVQGRRPKMEDRFVIDENINNTGISFFAIFDGHGGEFAADYAKDYLVQNLYSKIVETTNIVRGVVNTTPARTIGNSAKQQQTDSNGGDGDHNNENSKENLNSSNEPTTLQQRRSSLKKAYSTTDDCGSKKTPQQQQQHPDVFINKINSLIRTKDSSPFFSFTNGTNNNNNNSINKKDGTTGNGPPVQYEGKCYIDNGKINFGKMLTDEVLAADYKLVEVAKRTTNVAGTTALMAIMDGSRLIVGNVGDSRGVMCDLKGNAIPLSFDHKPQQVREHKRIQEAGGFIAFKGVWRVAGILATSRALGDYPLKDKKLVIADPDILSFDLNDHKPMFLILASDGLWDTFSNEEAVAFIKEHLTEPHFGAKSLTLQSYFRGSVDNITVLVIVFKDGKYHIGSSTGKV